MQTTKEHHRAVRRFLDPVKRIPDIWSVYVRYAESYPLLTPDEVSTLVREMSGLSTRSNKYQTIRNRIVVHNLRLVLLVVGRRYFVKILPLEDMIQEGQLGLIDAAEHFDPDLGTFAGYAIWRIHARVSRAIRRSGMVNIPEKVQAEVHRLTGMQKQLLAQFGHEASTSDLSKALGVCPETVEELKSYQLRLPVKSLTNLTDDEDREFSNGIVLPPAQLSAFHVCEVNEEIQRTCRRRLQLRQAVEQRGDIRQNHKEIFFRYYGLDSINHQSEKMTALASEFNYKKQAVQTALRRILRIVSEVDTDLIQLHHTLLEEAEHLRVLTEIVEAMGVSARIL